MQTHSDHEYKPEAMQTSPLFLLLPTLIRMG